MSWIAMVGQWDDGEPEPEDVYWREVCADETSALRAMMGRVARFISIETSQSDPCMDCVLAAGEELVSLVKRPAGSEWRGGIDGNDYVVTQLLDAAAVAEAVRA